MIEIRVIGSLERWPGATSSECAKDLGLTTDAVRNALGRLERKGRVRRFNVQVDHENGGRPSVIWELVS